MEKQCKPNKQIRQQAGKLKKTFRQFRGSRTKQKNFLEFKKDFESFSELGKQALALLNFNKKNVDLLEKKINNRAAIQTGIKEKPKVVKFPVVKGSHVYARARA